MYRSPLLIIFLFVIQFCWSQNQPVAIQVLAKSKKQGIWLRWAPVNSVMWSIGNKYGYMVERFVLTPDGNLENPAGEKLTLEPIKPISNEAFEKLANEIDEAAVVQELIYGEVASKTYDERNKSDLLAQSSDRENQFGMALLMCDLSLKVAQASGLFIEDTSILKGKRYVYRISLAFQPKGAAFEPGVAIVDAQDEKPLLAIKDLKAEFGDHKATLSWPTIQHYGLYSAYYIEESSDGKSFNRVSDLPYVHLSQTSESENAVYVDSLETNNQSYYYRIVGVTPFAELGPPSNVVSGSGKDNLAGFLILRDGIPSSDKKVMLKWEFPPEAEKEINGFIVSRSALPGGPFSDANKTIIEKTRREFQDATIYYNTYYIVRAVDNEGIEVTRSFPFLVQIEDTTPPAIPAGLKGSIEKNGKVNLQWQPNTDNDLLGYRVFRSNKPDDEFIEVTKDLLKESIYQDSIDIRVLNKKVYYNVVAVDHNFNPSDYSTPLILNKPDLIAPASPVFTVSEIKNGKINLGWTNSISEDVASLELTRIDKGDRISSSVITWYAPTIAEMHIEPPLSQGKTYRYKLTVYDSAGNFSEALSPEIFYETGLRESIKNLQVTVDRSEKRILLTWKNPSSASKCYIYRKKNDEPFSLYQTIEGNIETFTDKWVTQDLTYSYKVQLGYPKGIRSIISEEGKVKF